MPVSWNFAKDVIRLGGVKGRSSSHTDAGQEDGISKAEADRQTETTRSILASLSTQPGIVLADEVGMGKTYVAMATIASVLLETKGRPPVVVMTPPGLASKWRAEWQQFKATCFSDPKKLQGFRERFVGNPTEFFRAISDRANRAHLIWISTRCFTAGLQDPWVKLALCRIARGKTRMSTEARKKFYKWARVLVRMRSRHQVTPELIRLLMRLPLKRWHAQLIAEGIVAEGHGTPVPLQLIRDSEQLDCSSLIEVLNGRTIPGRRGAVSEGKLQDATWEFNNACQDAYESWIWGARWHASLLVLDEAHHAKNDATWLARMFRKHDAGSSFKPLLWNKFTRMLFLTATPFQLGHDELIRILRSFAAAKWTGSNAPDHDREHFLTELDELESRLNENRKVGRRLDDLWSRITRSRVAPYAAGASLPAAIGKWWDAVSTGQGDAFDRDVVDVVNRFIETKKIAQSDSNRLWASLRTWVVRHNRPTTIFSANGSTISRRIGRHGRSILEPEEENVEGGVGLDLGAEDPVPFLLAARAQGELAGSPGRGRAFFAEGLASSYEAFHHTRDGRGKDVRDTDDQEEKKSKHVLPVESIVPVTWYEKQIETFVPDRLRVGEAARHPKLLAAVQRVVHLWEHGEKVLLFCTYRETAKALREHIRDGIEKRIVELIAKKAGVNSERDVKRVINRVTRRLSEAQGVLHQAILGFLNRILDQAEFADMTEHRGRLITLLVAYLRSHSFIARYLPEKTFADEATDDGIAFVEALDSTTDLSGTTLRGRVQEFLRFARELAIRSRIVAASADDDEPSNPLDDYLRAVAVSIRPRDVAQEEGIKNARGMSFRALHVVRMVFGETHRDERERVMFAFNSPLFPEVLISSSVLGEGVDLHRFCRFVIHHDLSWNPSIIEQRTGRLDRIRCRAETACHPIVVYQPYIAESADEKLYRVLRDRERWFQVVMGQRYSFDEKTSEKIAERVPLPEALVETLLFDLRRHYAKSSAIKSATASPETTASEEALAIEVKEPSITDETANRTDGSIDVLQQ